MTEKKPSYWFPAKSYGFGWGLPITWQGWLVFIGALALFACGAVLFPPQQLLAAYIVYEAVVAALLIGICWWKGEPPQWRWGKKK